MRFLVLDLCLRDSKTLFLRRGQTSERTLMSALLSQMDVSFQLGELAELRHQRADVFSCLDTAANTARYC